jgi:DNA modification methylase
MTADITEFIKSLKVNGRKVRAADLVDPQRLIPKLAKDAATLNAINAYISSLETEHELRLADARSMEGLPDASVHLILTSPPYWTLKEYNDENGQLGHIADYDAFLGELAKVWGHCFRVLVPGGRLIVVVGDVCQARKKAGRHFVIPLHAAIQVECRRIGFDNLTPIIWSKIANVKYEVNNGSGFLGKPYEPNAIVKNDIEFILMQRKPGGYRQPTPATRILSVIGEEDHKKWFQQIWNLPGESTRSHPAPFPLELAERLVRMFSFVGDTVLDPFMGTGTTNVAAANWGRHSIGCEIDRKYYKYARTRFGAATQKLFSEVVYR